MIEHIKYGEKYRLELLCKSQTGNIIVFETPTGGLLPLDVNDLECVSPVPEKENTESAHKYDPCRKFRKGDKVRAVEYKGRRGTDCPNFTGKIYTVSQEERSNGLLKLTDDVYVYYIDPAYVELVTSTEELEPYSVGGSIDGCILYKNGEYYAEFVNSIDAERACKLLNAEHRKEHQ